MGKRIAPLTYTTKGETMQNINELKDLASFVCAVGDAVGKSMADGKVDASDLANLVPAILAAPKAFMGLGMVADEYFNLDEAAKAELFTLVQTQLDIPQKSVESIVEMIIKIALDFNTVVAAVVNTKKA